MSNREEVLLTNRPKDDHPITLKRTLGIPSGVSLLVGTIIGSGIFATPKWVLLYSGSVGGCIVVWTVCGLLALLGALCYLELGLLIPKSGGEYQYFMKAFGPLPAFLLVWTSMVVRALGIAILMLIFASYVIEPFFPGCSEREDLIPLQKCLAVGILGVITIVNCASVKLASRVQVVFTVAKMSAIAIIVLTGIVRIAQGHVSSFQSPFSSTETRAGVIGFAFYNALFSYDGWNNLNYVIEEMKNPKRNFPIAIWIAITMVIISYVLVNVGFLAVLTPEEVVKSNAVAVTMANRLYGVMSWIMPILVSFSVFGSVNGAVFAGGRLIFAAARQGHLPMFLAMIQTKRRTPLPAIILTFLISVILIVPGKSTIGSLLNAFSVVVWFMYGTAFTALLWFRYKMKDTPRPYKVFTPIPCLLILVAIYLVVASFFVAPIGSIIVFGYIAAGIPVYLVFIRFKLIPTGYIDRLTCFLQTFLDVAPPENPTELN